jgi:hypothetical protein
MKNKPILNLQENASRKEVEQALLNVSKKNKSLTSFIKSVFRKNKDVEILAYDDEGYKFDIECGDDIYPTEFQYLAIDLICDESEDDGWVAEDIHPMFHKYFSDFLWELITLDNGNILILTECGESIIFKIFDLKNLEDGKIEGDFLNMLFPEPTDKPLNN